MGRDRFFNFSDASPSEKNIFIFLAVNGNTAPLVYIIRMYQCTYLAEILWLLIGVRAAGPCVSLAGRICNYMLAYFIVDQSHAA